MILGLIVIGLVLLLILVFVLKWRPTSFQYDYLKKWAEIESLAQQEVSRPLAVIEADKLFDQALKESRAKGQTMAERLTSAQAKLSNYQSIWRAHQVRNRLVHEPDSRLSQRQTNQALAAFKKGIRSLGGPKLK